MEQTIGKMNKAFLDFNDKAIASGIGSWEPHLAQDLKSTMESFIDSARYLEQTSDDEGNETVPNLSARVFEEKAANSDTPAMISMDPPENQALTSEDAAIAALLGWTSNSPVVDESNIQNSPTEIEPALGARNHSSDWLTAEPLVQYRVEMPSSDIGLEVLPPALPESPPLPMSYSFQETSFARRLLRTALEGAYRVLTNPNTRSEDLLHFCKDTFTWTNRKHCIAWLEKALSKTARENLEYWGAPQLHIGGAGLHYPRTGFDTGTGPPPGWAADAPMGPLPFIVPEPLLDGCLSSVHDGESVDLSGEWFDSNDVEQYLQTKGLFLDGRSSYVKLDVDGAVDQPCEAHVPVTGSPTESSRDSNGYPPSPCMQDPILLDGPLFEENALFWDEEMLIRPGFEELDAGSLLDTSGFCHPKEASKPEVFGSVPPPLLMSSYRSMIQRYVDVEKFILGWSPVHSFMAMTTNSWSSYHAVGGLPWSDPWVPTQCDRCRARSRYSHPILSIDVFPWVAQYR